MDPNAAGSEPDLSAKTPAPEPEIAPEKPTPEQSEKAEALLRHYLLLKNRNDLVGARRVLDELVSVAPWHIDVVLARADDYSRRLQTAKAREVVKQAVELYPEDTRLETMYAELVLKASGMDKLNAVDFERNASFKSASILSAIIPGLGQMVVGEFVAGAIILGIWSIFMVWFTAMPGGMAGFAGLIGLNLNKGSTPPAFNPLALVAMFGASVTWIYAITNLSSRAKRNIGPKIDFPVPPIDKPY